MHVSKLSEFIQSDVPSNTLLVILNELVAVYQLGVQGLETLKELGICKKRNKSHNRLLEALYTFKATRNAFCLTFFSRLFMTGIRSMET